MFFKHEAAEKDFMQRTKNLMKNCVKGSGPLQSMERFAYQYRAAMSHQYATRP